ncbi:hypothetical protein CSUI_006176 [Cystoisospora suis]|uniref:Uncharacterized protein n=1 Tax=Cystoisospora suis TaxID=483139 RepID=A0A2C6KUZ9_9APIC|nr:hypothetical protein CSUI_006176 [Cystoisospora suis]
MTLGVFACVRFVGGVYSHLPPEFFDGEQILGTLPICLIPFGPRLRT